MNSNLEMANTLYDFIKKAATDPEFLASLAPEEETDLKKQMADLTALHDRVNGLTPASTPASTNVQSKTSFTTQAFPFLPQEMIRDVAMVAKKYFPTPVHGVPALVIAASIIAIAHTADDVDIYDAARVEGDVMAMVPHAIHLAMHDPTFSVDFAQLDPKQVQEIIRKGEALLKSHTPEDSL